MHACAERELSPAFSSLSTGRRRGRRSGGFAIGGERDALYSSRSPLRSSSTASNADGSTLSDPRLELVLGQRAKMDVVRPPRGLNSPRTIHHSGRTTATISPRILLTAFS